VLPPVKQNIYIPSPSAFLNDEGKQRAGDSGEGGVSLLSPLGPGTQSGRVPEEVQGARAAGALCLPSAAGGQAAWGCGTYHSFHGRQLPPLPHAAH